MAPPPWRLPRSWVRVDLVPLHIFIKFFNIFSSSDAEMVCWPISWPKKDTKDTESIFAHEYLGVIIQNPPKHIFTSMPSIQLVILIMTANPTATTSNLAFSSSETTQMNWRRGFRYFRRNTMLLDISPFHAVHGPLTPNSNVLQHRPILFPIFLTLLIVWIWAETEVTLVHTRCTGSGWVR